LVIISYNRSPVLHWLTKHNNFIKLQKENILPLHLSPKQNACLRYKPFDHAFFGFPHNGMSSILTPQ
ncbi:hypothetical protein, partial [Vibrio parahaemolyticus]|uniref:hypothetical protein n=1 Tax=Vibrio parahaemolyticus TaxID=670 RepID=UPI001C5D9B84